MTHISDVLLNSEELRDPIFVVGCARSGTSVLARTIGLSEVVCYFDETKFIPKYYTRRVAIGQAIRHWRNGEDLLPILKGRVRRLQELLLGADSFKELIAGMIRHTKLHNYDLRAFKGRLIDRYGVTLTPDDVKLGLELYDKYMQLGKKDIDKTVRILFKDFQILSGKERVLEKTPVHASFISTLMRIFPQAKICHIIRDGRDVAASYMLNFGEKKLDDRTIRHICRTQRRIWLIDQQFSATNNSRYYRVRYEDLVTKPLPVIEGVFNFLDLIVSERVRSALLDVKPTPSKWGQLPTDKQKYVEACLAKSRMPCVG